ncbi:hypothetical protein EN788_22120 [Mesorhizobium sp. M2D.F.Ca.ET.145.01.1.1]|nr:hypothetical protein EN789_21670 [bacterium M00.F.Ca.ET.146.01.1.1]TGU58443.1 hypothetical protein EN791_021670 [Mesorhizobium sp. M2D.F.Ca.ET.148.01.1.1]TGU64375.1 hypothetical protein EN790_21665 [Mesorhizobium sp. M2D.F.Ca.ET.147.01.1.1]TGW09951.1 hypothetical protein EN788_22120 [Mesorhizobium sp. M2D.F.Ca.ET.145.01.1.1]
MTEHELKKIVAEAVAETLLKLGIDASDPVELQKDMAHLRAWRESVQTVKQQGLVTAVGILVAGALGLLWLAFKGSP